MFDILRLQLKEGYDNKVVLEIAAMKKFLTYAEYQSFTELLNISERQKVPEIQPVQSTLHSFLPRQATYEFSSVHNFNMGKTIGLDVTREEALLALRVLVDFMKTEVSERGKKNDYEPLFTQLIESKFYN